MCCSADLISWKCKEHQWTLSSCNYLKWWDIGPTTSSFRFTKLLTGEGCCRNPVCVLLTWYKHNQQLMRQHLTENYFWDLHNKHRNYTKHLRSVNRYENRSQLVYVEPLILRLELNSNNLRMFDFQIFYFIVLQSGRVV